MACSRQGCPPGRNTTGPTRSPGPVRRRCDLREAGRARRHGAGEESGALLLSRTPQIAIGSCSANGGRARLARSSDEWAGPVNQLQMEVGA